MVAVLLVVANHLFKRPSGGFVGVDVFFVISGYLITALLLREGENRGSLSIREFYARRGRRILPVALLVLLTTNLISQHVFTVARQKQVQVDTVWAFFFSANIHFSAVGTDYFQQGRPPSAIQHFWSLSVEEQFYLVWPLLIVVAFLAATRLARSGRAFVLPIAITGVVASFIWCVYLTRSNQTAAYFSTPARAWELGLGAVLAVVQTHITRLPDALRAAGAWAGLGMIAASSLIYTDSTAFPGSAAVLPVLGSGLVLASSNPRFGPGHAGLLNNRVAKYLGNISYSLYLWHFPCIVLATGYFTTRDAAFYLCAGALPFALSVISYHLIEDPIRQSKWLSAKPRNHRRKTMSDWVGDNRQTLDRVLVLRAVVVVSGAALVLSVPTVGENVGRYALTTSLHAEPSSSAAEGGAPTSLAQLESQISEALRAQAYPRLRPSMDAILASREQAPQDVRSCTSPQATVHPCVWSSTASVTHTAVLVGDSMAMTFGVPLRQAAYDNPGWSVADLAQWGCQFAQIAPSKGDPKAIAECPNTKKRAAAYITANRPDIVFVANNYRPKNELIFATSVGAMLQPLLPYIGKVVFLAPPPLDKNIAVCFGPNTAPDSCLSHLTESWMRHERAQRTLAQAIGGIYVDTTPLYCSSDGRCPAFVGNTVVKVDEDHMTSGFEWYIVKPFAELLQRNHVAL